MSATETTHATCLPPEVYIRLWQAAKESAAPKFRSSYYPASLDKPKRSVKRQMKNKNDK